MTFEGMKRPYPAYRHPPYQGGQGGSNPPYQGGTKGGSALLQDAGTVNPR